MRTIEESAQLREALFIAKRTSAGDHKEPGHFSGLDA
jgi:hypothetical protein